VTQPRLGRSGGSAELSRLAGGAALTAAGGVVSGIAGFAVTAVVARGLGASAVGVFGLCMALSMIVTQAGKLGCDTAMVHFIPRLDSYGGARELKRLLARCLGVIAAAGVAVSAAAWLLAPQVANAFLGDVPADTAVTAVRMMVLGLPPASVCAVTLAVTRGMGDVGPLVVNDQIAKPLLRLVAVAAVIALGGGVPEVVLAWSLPQWVLFALALQSLRTRLRHYPPAAARLTPELRRGFTRYAGLRTLSATVEIIGANAGILIVGALAGTSEAGIFSVASRLVVAGFLTLQAVRLAVAPDISKALVSDVARAQVLHQVSTSWIILSAWPIYVVLAVLSPWVLRFFGPEFVDGWPVLTVLALGGLISVTAGNVQTVLLMGGRGGDYLAVAVGSVVLNVCAALALVPSAGALGAACASALASAFENLATIVLVRRRFGVRHLGRPVVAAVLVAAATLVPAALVARATGSSTTVVVGTMCVAAVAFVVSCWRWREALSLSALLPTIRRKSSIGD
jgi:O-antigen/teichoic acid export membrane protein